MQQATLPGRSESGFGKECLKMSSLTPLQGKLNLRYIRSALRSILTGLVVSFVLLLSLIWFIGSLGQWELENLQNRAKEKSTAYSGRIELANAIGTASSEVISQAKSYRTGRELRVAKLPYQVNLNKAKFNFDKLLNRGRQVWGVKQGSSPKNGVPAWRKEEELAWAKFETATERLWSKIEEEENNSLKKETEPNSDQSNQTDPSETSSDQPEIKEDFFTIRNEMDAAAKELVHKIEQSREQLFNEIAAQQASAASKIGRFNWLTIVVAVIIAVFTILFTQRQLTKTREAERREQVEKGRKVAVFDSLSDDIVVLGKQGEVLEVNHAFLKHFEMTDAELEPRPDYRAALAQVPEIASFVGHALQTPDFKQGQRERVEVKTQNGQYDARLFDVSISPLKVGDETHGRVVVMDDVTEAEQERIKYERGRALSAIGQITAQVAHEIYNPLGAVKLNLDLLEMQIGEDDDVKHTIRRLKSSVEHLSTIAMDLRYLTRSRDPERKPTDLNNLLDEVVELASDRLERSRICIVRDYSSESPHGEFDPQQLRKAFLNLLINAVEASPHSGEVDLRTRVISKHDATAIPDLNSSNGIIAVSIIDHGVGMSSETKRRVFEAFFTTKRNGTGLGMMITQEIVKKHGGKIEVDSEVGKGTTVNVYLPT
jgi:signal transduction histidine kinase